jgi:hypothetical protein
MTTMSKKQSRAIANTSTWVHQSQDWPLHEVLLSDGWDAEGALTTIIVARSSPRSMKIAAASFLVDLACLGVKSAFVRLCANPQDYVTRVRQRMARLQALNPAPLDLVAKILVTGEAYARQFGFSPDPEYQQARLLLAGANPEACPIPVPTGGPEGKPFFVAGPNDDPRRIVAQLTRAVGEGNFHYVVEISNEVGEGLLRLPPS